MTSAPESAKQAADASVDAAERLAEQTRNVQQWAERAHAAGWLAREQLTPLADLSGATSADLFAVGEPLVVALFGGTGVGKSSLLNRLVGSAVAKVGVVRPTSLEATLYVHRDVQFAQVEEQGFARRTHDDDQRRQVVWVDMPDVDSTAAHNRELVLGFLPYVDVLVYVVSPERYRDEAPWALLAEHAERSAWVFVMNQIDRGQAAQLDDLRSAVEAAGFADPLLFATSCGAPSELDEFTNLAAFIDSLAAERVREALQEEGRRARLQRLHHELQAASADWPADPEGLLQIWHNSRDLLLRELRTDLVERLAGVAARMAEGEAALPGELWDAWASDRVADALSTTALTAREAGWANSITAPLAEVVDDALAVRSQEQLRACVQQSLARPGSAFQRAAHAACGWLVFALPLAALLWIGWFVVRGFLGGATGEGEFVASGFAVNALLLLALAAGLPWLLQRLIEPSPRKAALVGIRQGLEAVIDDIDGRTREHIDRAEQTLAALLREQGDLLDSAARGKHTPKDRGDNAALTARMRPAD